MEPGLMSFTLLHLNIRNVITVFAQNCDKYTIVIVPTTSRMKNIY